MSRVVDRQAQKHDLMLSKSLHHKVSLSSRRRSGEPCCENSMIDSSCKLASRHKNMSLALSNTVNIQRRVDQQLDLSVRKLNLQAPERDSSFRQSKIVEARRLNFEVLDNSKVENGRQETSKRDHTSAVLNKLSSKLDTILKQNREDSKPREESVGREYGKCLNSSYLELSAKGSQLQSKPPIPPKEFTRPVWVSFGSRSRSRASNGSNGSKEDKKSEDKPDVDSSASLSKKSDYRVRYLPGNQPANCSGHVLDQSLTQNVLGPIKDLNSSVGEQGSVERKRKFSVKIPNQLCQTTSSMKTTSFSLLQLLDGKASSSRRRALRQSLSRAKLGESGKENRRELENRGDFTGKRQSIENVHIERKDIKLKKKNLNKVTAEKTFQLEEETDRKPIILHSHRFETSTGNGLASSTLKIDNSTMNAMSVQISKFEINDEIEQSRPSMSVAKFFNENMPTRVSPIKKPQVEPEMSSTNPQKEPKTLTYPDHKPCSCSTTISQLRSLFKTAELSFPSKPQPAPCLSDAPSALVNLKARNKQAAVKLLVLFVNRVAKGRQLSAMARIYGRYRLNKKIGRKAIVIAR